MEQKEKMRIVLTEIVLSILCWKWKLCVALVGKYFTFGARGKFERKVLALGIASVLSLLKKKEKTRSPAKDETHADDLGRGGRLVELPPCPRS